MVATNIIYCGDCLTILKDFPDECIDLIYLDPPFFSNRLYEEIWHDKYEKMSIEDRWAGGINHYVEWLMERLEQCKRVLKMTGQIYVHLDKHAIHYVKVEMDKLFGYKNFRNEIIWCYTGPSRNVRDFPDKHDNILRYVKGNEWTFNLKEAKIPYSESFLERRKHLEGKGGIYGGKEEKGKDLKKYQEGKLIEDWWTDIPAGGQISRDELLGYPTQKPESLLNRIIKVSSNDCDLVLDPFCGCGTTLVSAHKLNRKWIGIDISPTASKLMKDRLNKIGVNNVIVQGLPTSMQQLKNLKPFEFQNWVIGQLHGTHSDRKSGDMGIDGYILGTIPIQVKQSESVGRNVVDNFETAIRRFGKKKGVIVAFSFVKGAREEVARAKLKDGLDIRLITIDDILKPEFQAFDLFT